MERWKTRFGIEEFMIGIKNEFVFGGARAEVVVFEE
jgi:hypothetical protein